MARPIWTGSLSFGLVNVPVGLYSATDDKAIHFNQFQAGTSDRIRNRRVNERTGEEVDLDQIVKGYDLGGGEFVVITPGELEAAEPGRSKTIDISDFVELDDIDPVYYKSTYYLAPYGKGSDKAYTLLRQAMREVNKVGIATFVFRTKQHLVAIRPNDEVLALQTLFYADEVRDPARDIDAMPEEEMEFTTRELDAAKLLIGSMEAEWQPEQYRDVYREAVLEIIDRKARGETIASEKPAEKKADVVDLLAALERSVEAAIERRKSAAGGATAAADKPARATRAKAPATKAPAAKASKTATAKTQAAAKATKDSAAAEAQPAQRRKRAS
ncbi:MAG TPA: Ku protein [Acidimicrobiales bacterium]|nr:Ku protein [Acidimicrobiales bacterium]